MAALFIITLFYSVSAQTYTNPVHPDCADPGAIYYPSNDKYYVAVTGGDMAILSSSDLVNWTSAGAVFPNGDVPVWSNMNYWAPEIHQINNNTFNVYFTSNDKTNGDLLSVGVVTGSTPYGPFKDPIGEALVKGDSSTGIGYIDPNFFHDPLTKRNYILFKYDGNSKGVATPIFIQQLDEAGTHLVGQKKELITDDKPWEHTDNGKGTGAVQAPWMIYNLDSSYYYLFYSGSMYNDDTYNIGVARSKHLLNGTFVKFNGPILHTRFGSPYIMDVNPVFNGPGHPSVITQKNDNKNYFMIYASWKQVNNGGRNLMLDQIQWVDDWPRIFSDTPSQDPTTLIFTDDMSTTHPHPNRGSVSATSYTNPVHPSCADPGAIYYPKNDKYYVAVTGGGMAIYSSSDLVNWAGAGEVFNGNSPSWSNMNYWAPEIHQINNSTFNVYFTSNDKTNGNLLSVGVVTGSTPYGPFKDPIGEALVKGDSSTGIGYIDPNFFHDPLTKRNYILFKYDGNSKGVATPIFIQQLDATGTHLVGQRKQIITDNKAWEHTDNGKGTGCIEGPWMIYNPDTSYYYLFYSGSMYNTNTYNVGVARSKDLLNETFVKLNGPILHTRFGSPYVMDGNDILFDGPGHCSVITQKNDNKNYVMIYHSWKTSGGSRFLMLDQIQWVNGWPRIFTDTPSQDPTTLVFTEINKGRKTSNFHNKNK